MPKLVVLTVGFNDRSLEVKPEKTTVGRLEDNQFPLAEPSVSSHHCEIWAKGDDIVIKDLGSTNGSYINEKQLEPNKEATLRPGQVLRLGQIELRYETGKKQTDQPRQTVKISDLSTGQTMVMSKNSAFTKKDNKINKIFLIVGAVLVVAIIILLVIALTSVSGTGQ
ncbi:MAG TPA: FHA domain-containing protein [Candidatus Limnocylindria bacterium]|nr:FHA domain-containing protein [Candidatus Limnocylindria bacterium]